MSTLETARDAADVYGRLGMAPIVNGSGTVTILGGTLMAEEVLSAMNAAARAYVDLPTFLERAGKYLAERIGVPGAFISSGAAGGIAVAVAAVLSNGERERAWALPKTAGRPNEIVVLKTKGANYMHQAAEMVGGTLVEVGEPGAVTVDDFAAAIGPRTAAVLYVYPYVEATLKAAGARAATLSAVGKVARERGVPVLVDAAAELPPREKLTRFHQEGRGSGDLQRRKGRQRSAVHRSGCRARRFDRLLLAEQQPQLVGGARDEGRQGRSCRTGPRGRALPGARRGRDLRGVEAALPGDRRPTPGDLRRGRAGAGKRRPEPSAGGCCLLRDDRRARRA